MRNRNELKQIGFNSLIRFSLLSLNQYVCNFRVYAIEIHGIHLDFVVKSVKESCKSLSDFCFEMKNFYFFEKTDYTKLSFGLSYIIK